jgi:hypothetical protein
MLILRRLIGIIILTFLCVVVANAQSQGPIPRTGVLGSNEKPQTSEDKQHSKNDQHGTEQSPLVVKVIPSPNAQEEAAKAKKDKDDKTALNRRSEIITIAIAFATFLQAFALIYTIFIMVRTTRRQLRAYVFIDTIDILNVFGNRPPPIPGQAPPAVGPWIYRTDIGPAVMMAIKNSGQTPAYDVIHYGNICIREYPLASNLPPINIIASATRLAMSPGGITRKFVNMPRPLTVEEIGQLNAGTHAIYAYGNIIYKDTFKKKRFSNIRYFHNGTIAILGQTTAMIGCEEGNEAN